MKFWLESGKYPETDTIRKLIHASDESLELNLVHELFNQQNPQCPATVLIALLTFLGSMIISTVGLIWSFKLRDLLARYFAQRRIRQQQEILKR